MSSFDLLNIGTQSLRANQTALSVIGQNISNVNTDGYSRQVMNLNTRDEQRGVQITSIQRITDQFLSRQLWADTASFNRADVYADMAAELDNLLASDSTSISTAMDEFFGALQNAVDDPTSLPNRQLLVAQADALSQRFNDLDSYVQRQNQTINDKLTSLTQQINSLSTNIAEVNDKIRVAVVSGREANELKDQRDELIKSLSELVDVTVVDQSNGEASVFIGKGQPLVVGQTGNQMKAVLGDPDFTQFAVALTIAGRDVDVSREIGSGQIGGLLAYRNEVLNPAINELGRIAVAFSETMNEAHRSGIDLNGDLGGRLFNDMNSARLMNERISGKAANAALLSKAQVEISDAARLKASDYELVFNSASEITLTRISDGARFNLNNLKNVGPDGEVVEGSYAADFANGTLAIGIDGLTITLEAVNTFAEGDRFLIQPVRNAAAEMGTVITDGRQLALASPVRVATGADNSGTGVATVAITDIGAPAFATRGSLTPPVGIVFNNDTPMTYTVMDISDPANPTVLDLGFGPLEKQAFVAGTPIELDGYAVTIVNQPKPGDRFSFSYNSGGVSDNRNALLLSGLQQKNSLDGGSYQDIYGSLLEKVGTNTAVARTNAEANRAVLDSTTNAKASIVGVNMDEEAARLVQFQQAYQASAQLIRAAQSLFDTLINAM